MDEQVTHNPIEYLRIFFRRKWFIILPLFAGLVFGTCAGMVLPKKYLSSTIILVEEGKTDNPLFTNIAVSSSVKQRLATIKESMLGWNSLVELVKRLKLDQDVKTVYQFEQLILEIRKSIIIKPRGSNIIDLSYIGDDPKVTQAVVKNITDIFIERNVEILNRETTDAINFIEEQLKVYRGKIKSAEIAELNERLETLLIDSTESHPFVQQLREEIKLKREELKRENLEYTENAVLTPETTNPIIDEIKKALDSMGEKPTGNVDPMAPVDPAAASSNDIYKVMLLDKLNTVMARDVKVNESIYNTFLQRLETAKITQRLQSSKEGTKYTILDPPRVPLKPFKPNRLLVALIGLVLGGSVGVALVFIVEFLDRSFLDIQDANAFLGRPLLGAISKIQTPESVREESQRQRWRFFWMFSVGILVLVVTHMVSTFFNL